MSRQKQTSAKTESKPVTTSAQSQLLQSRWSDREPSPQSERAAPSPVLHEAVNLPIHPTDRPIIQPKLTIGPVGDQYEQEADKIATEVVHQINTPPINAPQVNGSQKTIQLQNLVYQGEEDKIQKASILERPLPSLMRYSSSSE